MKVFSLKVVILFVVVVLSAFSVQKFADRGNRLTNFKTYKVWNDIINSRINAEFIIQGNSRVREQISPLSLDTGLRLVSYNLGINGYTFKMQYYRFLLYLKYNKKPKYIIQSIDSYTTLAKMEELFECEQFIPYLDEEIIRKAVDEYGFYDSRDYLIPMYKYSHSFLSKKMILNGLKANFTVKKETELYKGFKSKNQIWGDDSFNEYYKSHANGYRRPVDSLTKTYFLKFIELCKEKEIKLIFVFTPDYMEFRKFQLDRDSINSIFKNFSDKYNIPILDYSQNKLCLDRNNFWDALHLNTKGVTKFNNILVADLKPLIK